MSLDLSSYSSIQTNLFVKLEIPGQSVMTFSDLPYAYTVSGTSFTGLGQLLSVTDTTSELRATSQEISIGISGIPTTNVPDMLSLKLKGSKLTIYRAFFNPSTGALLSITGNPAQKFQGLVSNYDISDELSEGGITGSVTLTLACSSVVALLTNKKAGRRTNPTDEKLYYPTDTSMDNVPALANSNFNFGAA